MRRRTFLTSAMSALAMPVHAADSGNAGPLGIMAAASLQDVLSDCVNLWKTDHDQPIRLITAGSATLARQIEAGSPAGHIFIPANVQWMERLVQTGHIDPASVFPLAGNRLVIAGRIDASDNFPPEQLPDRLGGNRLAIGLTQSVPAGIYGRQAMQSLGIWESLKNRIAETPDVRAALQMVASGYAPYGIVYATDVALTDAVRVVSHFPDGSHDPIRYPVGSVIANPHPTRAAVLDFLKSDAVAAIFARHGFTTVNLEVTSP